MITARTADGVVMALRHRELPVVGLQFHPEAVLTSCGYGLLASFLRRCGETVPESLPDLNNELQDRRIAQGRKTPAGGQVYVF
jgi:para-aminobenzoate synthetase component 2